jgi:hypothetical protein
LVNFYQTTRRYNPEDSHLRILTAVRTSNPTYSKHYLTIFRQTRYEHHAAVGYYILILVYKATDIAAVWTCLLGTVARVSILRLEILY